MKTFTIDSDNNITAHVSRTAALSSAPPQEGVFDSPENLATLVGGKRLVEIWNSLTGVTPVTKFTNALTGAKRIFAKIQTLEAPEAETPETPFDEPARAAPTAANGAKTKAPAGKAAKKAARPARVAKAARTKAKDASDGPHATSKTAQLIEMLKRKGGATLEKVMTTFSWQVHTTRALMSAGGALAKKHGLVVISEKVGDSRTYRIAK